MKTILIPVDFSETSNNAIKYAADMGCDMPVKKIILLKSYYTSVYEQILPSPDFLQLSADDFENERIKIEEQLSALRLKLRNRCHENIDIETVISTEPIIRAIHETIEDQQPDLMIVGGDIGGELSMIGEQIIEIAKSSSVKVLIIPANTVYQKIEQALVPCDFEAVARLGILKGLNTSHSWLNPKLMILYVDPKRKHIGREAEFEASVKQLVNCYECKLHYSEDKNIVRGILNFAVEQQVQLIIALPGKHSFFYNLTHSSITEALSLNARHPVLILK
ncbi:universal stress protein [Mucilaginibacter sp. cycad4]|uniref:universal stress protein n=1 Tax=Mucilaginibacter sp. cycad4 TaxID=3342096 RepID=UPI002AAB1676|nr:universal stress protein [Mucilaginibacter gossypii]WPU98589.1 universal stress protein [Mucilaginibacter gossypii]